MWFKAKAVVDRIIKVLHVVLAVECRVFLLAGSRDGTSVLCVIAAIRDLFAKNKRVILGLRMPVAVASRLITKVIDFIATIRRLVANGTGCVANVAGYDANIMGFKAAGG